MARRAGDRNVSLIRRGWPMALLTALAIVLALETTADETVVTQDGRRLTGTVTRDGADVVVAMKLGAVRLDALEVLAIEPDPASAAELERRAASLGPGDDQERLALAEWAVERRLRDRARALARPLLAGPRASEAARICARALLDDHVERAGIAGAAPEQLQAFNALGDAARRELVRRHAEAGAALAAELEAGGPVPAEEIARRYRERRGAVWGQVGEEAFQRATVERCRRAIRSWRRLEALYRATNTAPYLRARHAARFTEVEALEGLALDVEVPLGAALAYERALAAATTELDRDGLGRALGRPWQAERAAAAAAKYVAATELERELAARINQYRDALLLETLSFEPRLCAAAEAHNTSMIERGFFAHGSPIPGRREPADRVAATGYPWALVGEVLARYSTDPVAVFDAFLGSSSHHYALVIPRFREVGIAQRKDVWTAVMAVRR